ncbi:MAG: hypothetical protein QXD80_05700 [Acidilobaceae archaeon]
MTIKSRFKVLDNRLGVKASFLPIGVTIAGNPERLAFILHRITGIILVGFIAAHIISTNTLARGGWEAWIEEVRNLEGLNPISLLFIIAMGALSFHSINGIRLIMVEFLSLWIGRPEKPKPPYDPPSLKSFQRKAIYATFILALIAWVAIIYVMLIW